MHRRRQTIAFAVAALALSAIGVPMASAGGGGGTRVVDNDGRATATNCGASAATFSSIQDAVDATSGAATILVCPGTYPEPVVIGPGHRGLTLRAVRQWEATIKSPPAGSSALVEIIGSDDVTVRGFRIVPRTGGDCGFTIAAVVVSDALGAVIRGNRIAPAGTDTQGPCGYAVGLLLLGDETPPQPPEIKATANFSYNIVQDFMAVGIEVVGYGANGLLVGNSVQYRHLANEGMPTAAMRQGDLEQTVAAARNAKSPTVRQLRAGLAGRSSGLAAGQVSPQGGNGIVSEGIAVVDGGSAEIRRNAIYSGDPEEMALLSQRVRRGATPTGTEGGDSPILFVGIRAEDPNTRRGRLVVTDNLTLRTFVHHLYLRSDNATVRFNVAFLSIASYLFQATEDATIGGNVGGLGSNGLILSEDTADNVVRNNTLFDHETDCVDQSSGDGTAGTANFWTGNVGDTDVPDGICEPSSP